MPFSIKNPETERLARKLAAATGESLTRAITVAIQERLQRLGIRQKGRSLADELYQIAKRCAALPVRDRRRPEEILGYDERGLPD